jgi:alpha-tubulin suppressor-like RCC1 family protein
VNGELWCWGYLFGRPSVTVAPELFDSPAAGSSIALGVNHACILSTAGEAHCLGLNDLGQLGNETFGGQESVPVPVAGNLRFASLSASGFATCGLTQQGLLYCWGGNFQGQLGTGDREHRATPVRVRLP